MWLVRVQRCCMSSGVIRLVSGTGFCAFCLSGVPLVGLIGPELQRFKTKLHKNTPRRVVLGPRSSFGCWPYSAGLVSSGMVWALSGSAASTLWPLAGAFF